MRILIPLAAIFLSSVGQAQPQAPEPEWRQAAQYDVLLEPFGYAPRLMRLQAGQPVKLRFVNSGRGSYSFSAARFFEASRVHGDDAARVASGTLRLGPGERVTVSLVPVAGRYHVRSTNIVHRVLGMTGRIIVE